MGVTYRLCYIDGEGLENVSNIFPWQVVLIDEHNAFIYSQDAESNLYTVEHYDDVNITTYSENQDGTFSEVSQEPHMFTLMPIVEVVNNDEKLPEFRKVESLIDAYDRAVSDAQNELEEFRKAYMVVIGARIDADTVALARASGAFSLLPDQQGDAVDMKFLTKDVNDTFLEHHKSTLRENIYRFSSTVDMTDQKFSGADQSGEARKWKLLALENKVAIHERKFAKALRQMFKVLSTAWQVKGFTLDWNNISWTFDRNIPLELSMEATTTQALKGNVAERTRLSLLSFVEDPERELEEMDTERQVDLDIVSGAINNDQNNEEQ
jgi:SPP1 family phage portal protein